MTKMFGLIAMVLMAAGARAANDWGAAMREVVSAARAAEHLMVLTSEPHVAGTPGDHKMAQYVLGQWISFGLNATIEEEKVLLSWPISQSLMLTSHGGYVAQLKETPIGVDPTSSDDRVTPTFNAYSPSGSVKGPLVYANYGRMEDFKALVQAGVNIKGSIVFVRYGQIFRGLKVKLAHQFGAVGTVIYSDPADDGFGRGPEYPAGPWRPPTGVQRGSVQDVSLCAGDPRNPACSNDPNYNYTKGIAPIPVLPISWKEALPFLSTANQGPVLSGFKGGLNISYQAGPGGIVALSVQSAFAVKPIWNVVAIIPGEQTDQSVILGNHRDAWVYGAADPNSGTAAILEVARAFGTVWNQGWRPSRNVVLCSWDGEEYGLLGSSAFADRHAKDLLVGAIAYLNVDVGVCGPYFAAGATPSLNDAVRLAASLTPYPNKTVGNTILDAWSGNLEILGSGSDFTAFLDRYGVPSVDMGFGGAYGVYHSVFDSFHWMSSQGDPTFVYHEAIARMWATLAQLLSDFSFDNSTSSSSSRSSSSFSSSRVSVGGVAATPDLVCPYNFTEYAVVLSNLLNQTATTFASVGSLDVTSLAEAIWRLGNASQGAGGACPEEWIQVERAFLLAGGLPGRPYFRHAIQAPGLYTGYAAQAFPAVTDALLQNNLATAQSQVAVTANAVFAAADALEAGMTKSTGKLLTA